jgi:hypothetical protein
VDLVWQWGLLKSPVMLGIWSALGLVLLLFFLGGFPLKEIPPPDEANAVENDAKINRQRRGRRKYLFFMCASGVVLSVVSIRIRYINY